MRLFVLASKLVDSWSCLTEFIIKSPPHGNAVLTYQTFSGSTNYLAKVIAGAKFKDGIEVKAVDQVVA